MESQCHGRSSRSLTILRRAIPVLQRHHHLPLGRDREGRALALSLSRAPGLFAEASQARPWRGSAWASSAACCPQRISRGREPAPSARGVRRLRPLFRQLNGGKHTDRSRIRCVLGAIGGLRGSRRWQPAALRLPHRFHHLRHPLPGGPQLWSGTALTRTHNGARSVPVQMR